MFQTKHPRARILLDLALVWFVIFLLVSLAIDLDPVL